MLQNAHIYYDYNKDYDGGVFKITVSVFNQEDIESYEENENHIEIKIIREDDPQRGSSSSVLSHLNESSSLDKNVPQSEQNSNTSTQKNKVRYDPSFWNLYYKYSVRDNHIEKAQAIVDRAADYAFSDSKVRGKEGLEKWRKWEHDTKALYSSMYNELLSIGKAASAAFVLCLVKDADNELCKVDNTTSTKKQQDMLWAKSSVNRSTRKKSITKNCSLIAE